MADVKIVSASEMTRSKPYGRSRANSDEVLLSTVVYGNLSSLIKNSVLEYHPKPRSQYEEFIKDMDDVADGIDELSIADKRDLLVANSFLGTLGVGEDYPIPRDRVGNQAKVTAVRIKPIKGY